MDNVYYFKGIKIICDRESGYFWISEDKPYRDYVDYEYLYTSLEESHDIAILLDSSLKHWHNAPYFQELAQFLKLVA